jgi:formylglycine-generating enzyme required for sulfatase activity
MNGSPSAPVDSLPLSALRRVVQTCDQHEAAWQAGARPTIEDYLAASRDNERPTLFRRLLALEVELRRAAGEAPTTEEYSGRFPQSRSVIEAVFADVSAIPLRTPPNGTGKTADGRSCQPLMLGDYQLLDVLGKGGMGIVYRALQQTAGRVIALKVIRPELLEDLPPADRQEVLERFDIEGQAAAGLVHDHIVTVHDVGQIDGYRYYAMRLIEGRSLADILRDGPLAGRRAAAYLEPIARAVHYAHTQGIIHRDLKPRNVLVDGNDRPFVADFGLAKRLDRAAPLTITGAVLGTPSYMAPEQARGAATVGPAADVYSLGAVLYEMLTGRPPFQAADPVETMRLVIDAEPVPPRQMNPSIAFDLQTICTKCLRKEPAARYASAAELADDLARYRTGLPIHARPVSRWERGIKWARRRPAAAALVALALLAGPVLVATGLALERRQQAARANQLVEALQTAEAGKVAEIIQDLRRYRSDAEPALRQLQAREGVATPLGFRTALALLPFDDSQTEILVDRLPNATPEEAHLVRDALQDRRAQLAPALWRLLDDPERSGGTRLRAACILAMLDPDPAPWARHASDVVAALVMEDPGRLMGWIDLLRPVRRLLLEPLRVAFRERGRPAKSQAAASILAEYLGDDLLALGELLRQADSDQLRPVAARLADQGERAIAYYKEQLSAQGRPGAGEDARSAAARQRANVAAAWLQLDPVNGPWHLLDQNADPRLRTYLLHALAPVGLDSQLLTHRLDQPQPVAVRRAILLALGEYDPGQILRSQRDALLEQLATLYERDADPGVHSAAEWLVRRWGEGHRLGKLNQVLVPEGMKADRGWYVTPEGHVLTILREPVEFVMGSPPDEADRIDNEAQRRCRPAPFAIATKEVTLEQFRRFRPHHPHQTIYGPEPDCPVNSVSFNEAARYCNWLSERAGLAAGEWCYRTAEGGAADSIQAYPDHLSRLGYRLPTEEEWEYACRAGSRTSRFFGQNDDMLEHYAWYIRNAGNRTWPVGTRKPNDLGMFDMLGNALEWASEPVQDGKQPLQRLRGAAFIYAASHLRSATRFQAVPGFANYTYGFRVAHSLPRRAKAGAGKPLPIGN